MPGQKKRGRPPLLRSQGGDDAAAGLTGKAVLVPSCALAALASVHGHDRYLHGIIKGKDSGHQGCVLIKCREDPRTFYFDVGQVQGWMQKKEEGHVVISNANAQSRGQKEKHGKEEEQQSKRACVGHANRGSGHSIPNIDLTAEISRPKQYAPAIPPKKGYTMKAEVADLTGKEVDIPGTVFQNHTPGLTFRAYIIGPDSSHTSAVVLRLLNVPRSRYFFHASEVRDWLQTTQLGTSAEVQHDENEPDTQDEMLAAEVLAHMSAGGRSLAPSPSPSIVAKQPASTLPQPCVQAVQMNQAATAPAGIGNPASISGTPRHLCLGSFELIAHFSPLLPPLLAEKLLRIASLHSASAESEQTMQQKQPN